MATVGSGAVGGVFTPTLFPGAGLGMISGLSLQEMHVAKDLPLVTFAVAGMGSMLAATTRSPLLAMILVLEISLDYSLMPPLMLACVVSILVTRRLSIPTRFTLNPCAARAWLCPRSLPRPRKAPNGLWPRSCAIPSNRCAKPPTWLKLSSDPDQHQ